MNKKYELVKDDYIIHEGITLYRIKALKDFYDVKKGDLGGYVQSENNLSHYGKCWAYEDAKAYENAIVLEDAKIYDNVKVYGTAKICGYSKVYNDAEVYGNAKVYSNTRIYDNAKIFGDVYIYGNAFVCGNAEVYGNAEIYGNANVCGNANIYGKTLIYGNAEIFGNVEIQEGNIIGNISMPFKDLFQHQCKNRLLTAILTKDDEILYTIGCQDNITEKEFIDKIYNDDGGLEKNPHREEYLKLIPLINIYFKGE